MKTDFANEQATSVLNEYRVLLTAWQGEVDIRPANLTPYKILKIDDLEAYNPRYTNLVRDLARQSDMVIGPYAYDLQKFFPHPNIVWVPYSSAIEEEGGLLPFNDNPIPQILASGSVAPDRAFRKYVFDLQDDRIAKLHHPGYGNKYLTTSQAAVKANWYRELNKYLAVFCDAHSLRYIHLRVFEAP